MPNKRVFPPAHKCSKTMLSKPSMEPYPSLPYVKSFGSKTDSIKTPSNKDMRNTVSLDIVYDVITTKDQKE